MRHVNSSIFPNLLRFNIVKIQVDNNSFTFCDHRFIFDLYYFDDNEWQAPTSADTFKKMLLKWAEALQDINEAKTPLFLPFAPDDEGIQCLRATYWGNDQLTFSWVELAENGYAVNLIDVQTFSTQAYTVSRESPEFGECRKHEVISALINAEVIDGPWENRKLEG